MQMVGVAEHDLRTDVLQVMGRQAALDGAGGGNILECGGLHRAVYSLELAPPGVVLLLEQLVGRQRRHNVFPFCARKTAVHPVPRGQAAVFRNRQSVYIQQKSPMWGLFIRCSAAYLF